MIRVTIYIFTITLVLSELVVRNAVNWIPEDLIEHLSPDAVLQVHKARGQVQDENSYIYHYRPFQTLNHYPHVKIDENGYRNSVNGQKKVDMVLLGDSIIFSKNSEVDLGDLFRKKGISTLNLAIGGYAPQHYRDTYKKYVIDKNIQHDNVIVNIFVGNDFSDAVRYPWKIQPPEGKGSKYYPWIINLIIGAIDEQGSIKNYNLEIKESANRISLPYREIGIRYLWWTPAPSDTQWSEVDKALRDILQMASKVNARVSFVIVPSPASVYGVKLHPDFSDYNDNNIKIVNEFKKRFSNINIIDPNEKIAEAIESKFLYIQESDAHFNTYGIKIFFNIILEKLDLQ